MRATTFTTMEVGSAELNAVMIVSSTPIHSLHTTSIILYKTFPAFLWLFTLSLNFQPSRRFVLFGLLKFLFSTSRAPVVDFLTSRIGVMSPYVLRERVAVVIIVFVLRKFGISHPVASEAVALVVLCLRSVAVRMKEHYARGHDRSHHVLKLVRVVDGLRT